MGESVGVDSGAKAQQAEEAEEAEEAEGVEMVGCVFFVCSW